MNCMAIFRFLLQGTVVFDFDEEPQKEFSTDEECVKDVLKLLGESK